MLFRRAKLATGNLSTKQMNVKATRLHSLFDFKQIILCCHSTLLFIFHQRMNILKPIDRSILRLALPSIITNITVPLLGLVDLAIVGHMGSATYIGAVAVGSMTFNVIYWIFGFLRMGTSGMTSQALGRRDFTEVVRLFLRSLTVGLLVALGLLVLQKPLFHCAMAVISPSEDIVVHVRTYYNICIWGAPAMLCLYGITGWYIGMQNTRMPMCVSIMQNIVNIVASLGFVYAFGMKIEGVALGTLIAQYAGFITALLLFFVHYSRLRKYVSRVGIFTREAMKRFFTVNRDIFIRTLFLVSVNLFFLSAGAKQGAILLAVNTLLMQLFTLFSYVMDGFAYAGEAICGRLYGANNAQTFRSAIRHLFAWGIIMILLYTAVYAIGGQSFLSLLTNETTVLAASKPYFPWAVLIPVAGMAAFVWDGVFIGTTATRGMMISSILSALMFFAIYLLMKPLWGNHALWFAFIIYLFSRGAIQTVLYKRTIRTVIDI